VTKKMRDELRAAGITTPLITSNRINTPRSPTSCWPTAAPTW